MSSCLVNTVQLFTNADRQLLIAFVSKRIFMEYKLTTNRQYSHHDKDGADRNYISYFLNDVLILKQKIPFDANWEHGFDRRTSIYDEYILNGKMYQKRRKWLGCSNSDNDKTEIREVSFPLSKNRLAQFDIPTDLKIVVT